MNTDEIKALAIRLAALVDVLEERSEQAVREMTLSSGQLQLAARGLGGEGQKLAREAVSAIGAQAQGVLQHGLRQAIDQCKSELHQVARQAGQTASDLQTQRDSLRRAQTGMLWKCSIGLLVGAVLAAGGSGYLAWRGRGDIRQAEFSSAMIRATQSGALTHCDDVLCVKVRKNAPRFGKNSDYVLLQE